MFENPKKFFARELLLFLITIILLIIIVVLTGMGNTGIIIAALLAAINGFAVLFMFVLSFIFLVKAVREKGNQDIGMHIVNFVLSFFFAIGYILFYVGVILIAMIPIISLL
jgi:hypothetical protein